MERHNNGLIKIDDVKTAMESNNYDPTTVSTSGGGASTRRQSSIRSKKSGSGTK